MFCAREDWRDFGPSKSLSALLVDADRVLSEPLPRYEIPEAMVGAQITLHDALQELWQRSVGDNMVLLAAAASLCDKEEYRRRLHSLVLAACEYPTWGQGIINGWLHVDNNLSAAHLMRGIAVAWNWHRDLFSAAEQNLILDIIRQRGSAMLRGLYGDAFWSTAYTENHNQVSAAGLGLLGAAFLNDLPEAGEWLAAAVLNFRKVLAASPADGSSEEGVSYWTYGLSFVLQYIKGTRHITDSGGLYQSGFLRNAASFRIGASTPSLGDILRWGDAFQGDTFGPHHLLYRLAGEYGDEAAQYLARGLPFEPRNDSVAYLKRYSPRAGNGAGDIAVWTLLWENRTLSPKSPAELDHHAKDWDVLISRSGWERNDYLLSVKAGFTNRNHSHLDAGAIAFCSGDEWLVKAPGIGKGAGDKEFWEIDGPRWEYFSNATESHSTLVIDGKNQRFDREARGTIRRVKARRTGVFIEVDLTRAYETVLSVRRRIWHRRGKAIHVRDDVLADKPIKVEWLAQVAPEASCDGREIFVPGRSGGLLLSLQSQGSPFFERLPASTKYDVETTTLRTFASIQTGQAVRFSVVLTPIPTLATDSNLHDNSNE
jgi:hypothetical protein